MEVSARESNRNPRFLLHAIIEKAKAGGFCFKNILDEGDPFSITSFNEETGRLVLVFKNNSSFQLVYDSIYLMFFDTTFARAVFGADWEAHLEQLAVADDKLDFLTNHLQTLTNE